MNQQILNDIVHRFGTPCFVYDFDQVRERAASLHNAFAGRFAISYAMKANPNPAILRRMRTCVPGLDVSSGGELQRALALGWAPRDISFTGAAKRTAELSLAVESKIGAVVVESMREANELNDLAAMAGTRQKILLRLSPVKVPPGFGSRMAGRPSQFGVDEEDADAAVSAMVRLPHVELAGFHIYSGTQCLNAEAIAQNYKSCAALFARLCEAHHLRAQKLIFGSGLGIPYHDQDRPLDLAAVAATAAPALDALRLHPLAQDAEFILETGRYLVGEAGLYLTRVVSTKRSRGVEIRICDGGMNHHLGACGHLGSLLHRNYRMFK